MPRHPYLQRIKPYFQLMRLDKPIGILLLLWPTLWALWLASAGQPDKKILFIFIAGVILMRSAGCVLNDVADRKFDGHVKRTQKRPLPQGKVSVKAALILAAVLSLLAFLLVCLCNGLTIMLAVIAAGIAAIYPFMKRVTHWPQLVLGIAFSLSVPMAFAAETGVIPFSAWFLFLTSALWPLMYDTLYAMTDREDDRKIGVKSTAILFGSKDRLIIGLLQIIFMAMLIATGFLFDLHGPYYFALAIVSMAFLYQQWLIKDRAAEKSFTAFLNNNLVGFAIFSGILSSYL